MRARVDRPPGATAEHASNTPSRAIVHGGRSRRSSCSSIRTRSISPARSRRSSRRSSRARGAGEAGAAHVRAGDRDAALRRHQRGGRGASRAAPDDGRAWPPSGTSWSAPRAPTRSARWEDQAIVERPRYRELVEELGYIARRELIFGTHVHVAIEGADRAIYVADGIRRFLPLLLALSTNSPFWRGHTTGMMSARIPVFRAFPREGIPPHYGTWEIYSHRVGQMVRAGAIEDYTFMWWDVRPHPSSAPSRLGSATSRRASRKRWRSPPSSRRSRAASRRSTTPRSRSSSTRRELIDDNKVRAAIRGMEGELVDFRAGRQCPRARSRSACSRSSPASADALGCASHLETVGEILREGTGARRQLALRGNGAMS